MEGYAFDTFVLMCVQFWHVFFIISMGIASAFFLLRTTSTYTSSTDVEIYRGFKLLVIGLFVGSTNYLAAKGTEVNHETLLKLVGFS